jgi:threonine-phosphate decarboxylase
VALLKDGGHGGNVYVAARELGKGIGRLIDFSASINPLGPSPRALRAIVRARALIQHYPDPECWALRQSLAKHWRLNADQFVVGNGSTELIHLLPLALPLRHVLVVGPTFSEYAKAIERAGGRVSMVMADRAMGYTPPIERTLELVKASGRRGKVRHSFDAIVLCNPNSPTGQVCDADEVMTLARLCERHSIQLVVDETFAEYCEERSILPVAVPRSRAIVLRSFTKFYGLPGLRVGYLVTAGEIAQRIHSYQPPWSVNTFAQEAARAALNDHHHAKRSRSFMSRERSRFQGLLKQLPGCAVFPSQANFILMELPVGWGASVLTERLRRRGLLIRDCSAVPGLNERMMRMAVRTRADNDRLAGALASLLRRG